MITVLKNHFTWESRQRLRACMMMPNRVIGLLANYLYDATNYLRASSTLQWMGSRTHWQAWIDADAHKLEKGLALQSPRPGFGKGVAERLVRELKVYLEKYDNDTSTQNAIRVLSVYRDFNCAHNIDYAALFSDIKMLCDLLTPEASGGYCWVGRDQWLECAMMDMKPFFQSRRSVRDFSDETVSIDLIRKAVEMAAYTPTVCNRQAVKTHAFTDPAEVQAVLGCQQGNRGFGHTVKNVLVVTVDRQCFFTEAERNQCWIDGGLFSMSLIYALHSLGLGSCCLNWSVNWQQDQKLKRLMGLSNGDAVIMMIAVGHLRSSFKVASSPRKSLSHFLIHGLQNKARGDARGRSQPV